KRLDMVELLHEGCWTGCCLCNAMGGLEKDDYKMFPEEAEKVERYIDGLPDMIHGSEIRSCMEESNLYVPSVIITTMDPVPRSEPTVGRLAIRHVTVKADLLPTTTTTTTTTIRGPKGQMQGVLLALSVEFKDTTRVSAQS
nr:hypothetical protein [Tanacetum cinerariifolium]